MIRVRQIKINVDDVCAENLKKEIAKKLNILEKDIINFKINKKSLDARKKPTLYFIYEIDVETKNEELIIYHNKNVDILITPAENLKIAVNPDQINKIVHIIGMGPAGLFAAYTLAINGFKPVLYDRGKKTEDRVKDVYDFFETNKLNEESNIQFGEGGAGTFSDGKLNTLIKDKEHFGKFVLSTLVKFGAPEEIIYETKAHIGTNLLREVIINIRKEIISLGGEFNFQSKLTNLIIDDNKIKQIEINNGNLIDVNTLILAIGHSARDTFKLLHQKKFNLASKPFAVGLRVMHPQGIINESQIGFKNHKLLKNQSYKLTYTTKESNRGVYTFCMCPGGYIVNASSEKNKLVVNGMSNYERESGVANSAVIVTINNEDYGDKLFGGIDFQTVLEQKAFLLSNGKIPVQTLKDFKENKKTTSLKDFYPKTMGEYELTNLRTILPEELNLSIIEAMDNFGKKIKNFNNDNTLLAGVESRTSSPIKIIRDENFEANIKNIYPIGEGSGYAGGITSSGIDGVKIAKAILEKI